MGAFVLRSQSHFLLHPGHNQNQHDRVGGDKGTEDQITLIRKGRGGRTFYSYLVCTRG